MNRQDALVKCKAIRDYLTNGNPIWSKKEVTEAMTMAIEALEVMGNAPNTAQHVGSVEKTRGEVCEHDTDYEQAVMQLEHDMLYEPTYNPEDGSM